MKRGLLGHSDADVLTHAVMDALLGAAWPSMYPQLGAGVSWAGGVSMIISVGTIVSSLASDRLNSKLGTGKVTALSVATTAVALFSFSTCTQFWQLCLWAIPYGLGAGSVDAALNNYVALHYESRRHAVLCQQIGVGAVVIAAAAHGGQLVPERVVVMGGDVLHDLPGALGQEAVCAAAPRADRMQHIVAMLRCAVDIARVGRVKERCP